MRIVVNGQDHDVFEGITVGQMLDLLDLEAGVRGIAVTVDASVVRRPEWYECVLAEGCQVEVLTVGAGR